MKPFCGDCLCSERVVHLRFSPLWLNQVPDLELAIGFMGWKMGFEVFTSGFAWACCTRWVSILISVNEPLMAINVACLSTFLPPQYAEARLGEKLFMNGYALKTWEWSLMASPSIRKAGRMMSAQNAPLSRCSKLFYTIDSCCFHIESSLSGCSCFNVKFISDTCLTERPTS